MNEFVKTECSCNLGYDKGALKKTLENNIFTIFGNLNQNNSIIIRYHGQLTEENSPEPATFNIFYCFDSLTNDKKEIPLCRCRKCLGECYCSTIDLENHKKIFFSFGDNNGNLDTNSGKMFELNILPDPISSFMQRYGFELNTSLPTYEQKTDKLHNIKDIISKIKNLFNKLFSLNS